MIRALTGSLIALTIVALCLLAGCGGGAASPPGPGPVNTATIQGTVVRADIPTSGIGGATVEVRSATGQVLGSAVANGAGQFQLAGLPTGDVSLFADTPNEGTYDSQEVPDLHLDNNDVLQVVIAILRLGDPPPTRINLTPTQAIIDIRGHVNFNGAVVSDGVILNAVPTFILTGAIGAVDRTGYFTATQVGLGQLIAVSGGAQAAAGIEVTPARNPQVTTYLVAPLSLRASGGDVTITVTAHDGDGILQVIAEVYKPDTSQENVVMPQDPLTDETYRVTYGVPPNSNPIDGLGHQDVQRYPIRVRVQDTFGNTTYTAFVEVAVDGIDTPPPPFP
jgi:hypothetical protein